MLIRMNVPECDSCGVTGNMNGAGAVARGATGRWCIVMYLCPGCADVKEAITPDEAHKKIEEIGGNDWADF